MEPAPAIAILPFQPENQAAVKDLVLAGLTGHWGTLDPDKNPDLNDIQETYASAIFLVAWHQNRIVGTGALIPGPDHTAEIVRMSVAAEMRRKGIGRMILQELCASARSGGVRRLVLETTDTWHEVIAFYQRFGFQITHYSNGDVYFALDLL